MISFIACGPSEEEKAKAEAEAQAAAEEMLNGIEEELTADENTTNEEEKEQLAEHVCNKDCTAEKCAFKCGEKGHVCTESCHGDVKK
ncbi:MAG: hypothetical protein Kow0079_11610 [Vicingaceae bacterium]